MRLRLQTVRSARPIRRLWKRLFDLGLGSVLAVIALPVILFLGIAMSVSLRATPFFIHERVGRDGATFRVPKIRTLPNMAPRYADKQELQTEATTRLGRVLRRLHLDELPQLLLVIAGRMSLVGPRPEMAHLYSRMPERQGGTRLRVRPGCTGLWQVSTAYNRLIADAPEYDIFYVEHHNWRLDLWILWRTGLMMAGAGAPITLQDVPQWAYPRRREVADNGPEIELERRRAPREDLPGWYQRIDETAVRTRGDIDRRSPTQPVEGPRPRTRAS